MSNRAKAILLLIVDFAILFILLFATIYIRKSGHPSSSYIQAHIELFTILYPIWILIFFIEGMYTLRTYNPANLPISVIRGTLLSLIASILVIYLVPNKISAIAPKTNLAILAVLIAPAIYGWRRFFFAYFAADRRQRNTILIGSKETLSMVEDEIRKKPHLGYRITHTYGADEPVADFSSDLIAIERNFTRNSETYRKVFSLIGETEVIDLANFAERISGKIPVRAIDESWFIEYCGHQESQFFDIVKSLIDKTVAITLVIILIPLAIVLFPILLVVHGRPIFFTQTRTGLNNKSFKLYKLRSMVIDAEKTGAQWAKPGDARITPLGKILRKTRLDELPQLWNILKGEMSLVGPRPERPEIIEAQLINHIPFYSLRHLVKPGVTGWAQVTFRYGFSKEDSLEKLQYDLFYVKNRSLWLDILVLLKTVKTVLTGAGQ